MPILHAGTPLGTWGWIVWDPRRFMAAYAMSFVDELVRHTQRAFPGREFARKAPPLPPPGGDHDRRRGLNPRAEA
jgi:hypothetical protein